MYKRTIYITLLLLLSQIIVAKKYEMLVGTYTRNSDSEGIYYLKIDKKAKIKELKLLAKSDNPSYLSFSPDKQFVYAVNEHGEDSEVSAFRFDMASKELHLINKVSAAGADPCYITSSEKHVFIANYSSGSISVFQRNGDGSLSEAIQVLEHSRMHYGNNRFGPSNAHQIIFSPDSNYLYSTNLGTDRVIRYSYEKEGEKEVLKHIDELPVKKLSGPRHMEFSSDGQFLYLIHEHDASLTVMEVADNGSLNIIEETTVVTDSSKENGGADIHLSVDNNYLYASNRGENNDISLFKIEADGKLKLLNQYSVAGKGPRNFIITSDNKSLIVANQHSNNIVVFKKSVKSGKLKKRKREIEMAAPVCLLPI